MRQSKLFGKTQKIAPSGETAKNAALLERAGFVQKTMAGVYSFLPLGWKVLDKIEDIVREEMNNIGAEEIFMPALHPKENWVQTGRWDSFDALYKVKSTYGSEYALGPTHEEIIYPFVRQHLASYKDLPICLYQIQTKFRDEARAKSGLLRGREFRMKDLYSFHIDDKDRDDYYGKVSKAYNKIFARMGLNAIEARALGGTFSDISTEFQVVCEAGEDTVYVCKKCSIGINKELVVKQKEKSGEINCPNCGGKTKIEKTAEVGNIFPLKDKFAKDFNLVFKDDKGEEKFVSAGCYGLGTTRLMGTVVEVLSDDRGIVWPEEIAPMSAHLIELSSEDFEVSKTAEKLYEELTDAGIEVLYDDRYDKTAGEKFADADLIGIPKRIVISKKTLKENSAEVKGRSSQDSELVLIKELVSKLKTPRKIKPSA